MARDLPGGCGLEGLGRSDSLLLMILDTSKRRRLTQISRSCSVSALKYNDESPVVITNGWGKGAVSVELAEEDKEGGLSTNVLNCN